MLRKITKEELDGCIDWAYTAALDKKRSSFPAYWDGIKTKEDFIKSAYKTFESDCGEILLFTTDGQLCGLINYYALKDDKYIGLNSFNIICGIETSLEEFEDFCRKKFKGFDLYMGFPEENREAVSYFKNNGYRLLEKSFPTVFHFDKPIKTELCPNIEKITKDTYGKFKALHENSDGDMYWNCKRIYEAFNNWTILYYADEITQAAVYYVNCSNKLYEIFGVDFKENKFDKGIFKKLIFACLADLYKAGAKHPYCFAEENELEILLNSGFENIGNYNCYLLKLN